MVTKDVSEVSRDGTCDLRVPVKLGSLGMVIHDLVPWYPESGWGRGMPSGGGSAQPDSTDLTSDPALIPGGEGSKLGTPHP